MKGYVARKGNRWYAIVYEGVDPISGRNSTSVAAWLSRMAMLWAMVSRLS